jgi:hypothetical protein
MLLAYIDESGITPHGDRTSQHFVLSAAVFDEDNADKADRMLLHLRRNTGANQERVKIHFNDIQNHGARRYMSYVVGTRPWLSLVSVIVCKRALSGGDVAQIPDIPAQYNYTFRFLLERLSWLAQRLGTTLSYTAASLGTAPPERLAEYEAALRRRTDTEIKWDHLENPAGRMVAADDDRRLDLADIVASATARAYEPDEWGLTERLYLRNLAPALMRSTWGSRVSRYGLKVHPSSVEAKPEYAWALTLPRKPGEVIPLLPESEEAS